MKSVYFFGECMVELSQSGNESLRQSFAGDVYNSGVYLKRCFPLIKTSMLTAVGQDKLSDKMIERFAEEGLDTELVFKHDSKVPGLYMIETDKAGERSFIYWRSDAAAKKSMDFVDENVVKTLSNGNVFFFSGISLAIIDVDAREKFWSLVSKLSEAGVKIVFDPNYRARLWANEAEAISQFDLAFQHANIILPGVEDFDVLYGISTTEEVMAFCQSFNFDEVIVKNGPESVISVHDNIQTTHEITPVTNVVDTTSAGDAFNGAYLGARLQGMSIDDAVKLAAKAAGTVIQFPGAIAPVSGFKTAMQQS